MKNNNQVIPKTLNSQTRKLISTGLLVASITTVPFKIASDYPYSSSTAEFRDLQNNFSTEDDLIVSKLYQEVEIFKKYSTFLKKNILKISKNILQVLLNC